MEKADLKRMKLVLAALPKNSTNIEKVTTVKKSFAVINIYKEISRNIVKSFAWEPLNDFTRISTHYELPDGSLIDLFLQEKEGTYLITDLGETLGWLYLQTSNDDLTAWQLMRLNRLLTIYKVELKDGMLISYTNNSGVHEAIINLLITIIEIANTKPCKLTNTVDLALPSEIDSMRDCKP
ncbi:MAG: DUF1828 domain-containing protein [Crinalium sp.]